LLCPGGGVAGGGGRGASGAGVGAAVAVAVGCGSAGVVAVSARMLGSTVSWMTTCSSLPPRGAAAAPRLTGAAGVAAKPTERGGVLGSALTLGSAGLAGTATACWASVTVTGVAIRDPVAAATCSAIQGRAAKMPMAAAAPSTSHHAARLLRGRTSSKLGSARAGAARGGCAATSGASEGARRDSPAGEGGGADGAATGAGARSGTGGACDVAGGGGGKESGVAERDGTTARASVGCWASGADGGNGNGVMITALATGTRANGVVTSSGGDDSRSTNGGGTPSKVLTCGRFSGGFVDAFGFVVSSSSKSTEIRLVRDSLAAAASSVFSLGGRKAVAASEAGCGGTVARWLSGAIESRALLRARRAGF